MVAPVLNGRNLFTSITSQKNGYAFANKKNTDLVRKFHHLICTAGIVLYN